MTGSDTIPLTTDTVASVTANNMAHWDAIFSSRGWGRYPPEELVRFMARTFRDPVARGTTHVLEVGCGPGPNIWYLAREGYRVAGIDGSPHAIDQARQRLVEEGCDGPSDRVDLRTGDFSKLPWPDETFDAVLDIEALYANTFETISLALDEIYRVLKPGGWFFGKMFDIATDGFKSGERIDAQTSRDPSSGPLAGTGITHGFTEAELRSRFSGYRDLSIDHVHRTDRGGQDHILEWLVRAQK